jgi:hypothetical protein
MMSSFSCSLQEPGDPKTSRFYMECSKLNKYEIKALVGKLGECLRVIAGVIYQKNYSYNIFHECLAVVQTCDKILSDEKQCKVHYSFDLHVHSF